MKTTLKLLSIVSKSVGTRARTRTHARWRHDTLSTCTVGNWLPDAGSVCRRVLHNLLTPKSSERSHVSERYGYRDHIKQFCFISYSNFFSLTSSNFHPSFVSSSSSMFFLLLLPLFSFSSSYVVCFPSSTQISFSTIPFTYLTLFLLLYSVSVEYSEVEWGAVYIVSV